MHAEEGLLCLNEGTYGQIIKQVCKIRPYVRAIKLALTLSIEAIHGCRLSSLVVAPNQSHAFRVPQFQQKEIGHCFDREGASIHIVTQEQIVCVRQLTTNLEDLKQVVKLTMHVSNHRDGSESIIVLKLSANPPGAHRTTT